jgi:hypothetical protein
LENLAIDRRIILKPMLIGCDNVEWTPVAGSCDHGEEPSDF